MAKYQPVASDSLVKIGQAAKILGVSIDTLRRWEEQGKLKPIRTPGQTRLYSLDELRKLTSPDTLSPIPEDPFQTKAYLNSHDDPFGSAPVQLQPEVFNSQPDSRLVEIGFTQDQSANLGNDQSVDFNPSASYPIGFQPNQSFNERTPKVFIISKLLVGVIMVILLDIIATSGILALRIFQPKLTLISASSSHSPLAKAASVALEPLNLQADWLLSLISVQPVPVVSSSSLALDSQSGEVLAATSPSQVYLEVNSDETVNGTLTINGNSVVRDSLTAPNITGNTTVSGNLTTQDNLNTLGSSSLNGGLTVGGNMTVSNFKAGIVKSDANGKLSSSAIDLSTSDITGTVPIANGGTGATTAGTARGNLGAAASGSNSDITSLTGLSTALSIGEGGTGLTTYSTGDLIYGSASNTLKALGIGTSNQVLTVINGIPAWSNSASGGVTSLNSLTGALTISGGGIDTVSSSGSTISITGTEADTLASVTGRGATTSTAITLSSSTPLTLSSTTPKIAIGASGTLYITNGTNNLFTLQDNGTTGTGTFTADLAVNGSNLTTTNTGTFNVFNTNAATINFGGAATTMNLVGGSSGNGCTINGSNGNLTCKGNITGNGNVGYWTRNSATHTISPATTGDILSYNMQGDTSGTFFSTSFGASTTLSGSLTGESLDLSTNVIASNQDVTGDIIDLPTNVTNTNTSGTDTIYGLEISPSTGSGINQNGSGGTTTYSAITLTIPALTQSAGTLTGNGVNITTPSSITTGGTANGINIAASGVGAGTLNGIDISGITASTGIQNAIDIGTGWNSVLKIGSTTVINGSGITQTAGGGTGLSSFSTGDLIYASGTNTLANRSIGSSGQVLEVSGGVPAWGTITGSSCTDCLVNDPSSSQSIAPTGQATTGLIVKQTSSASPTQDIFDIENSGGSTKYFYVDSSGNVSTAGTSGQTLTLTPLSDTTALTLNGNTHVTTADLADFNLFNTQGTGFKLSYAAAQTLGGSGKSITGEKLDLNTNVTATDTSVTGLSLTLPGTTNTTSTATLKGLVISAGGGIASGTSGSLTYSAADLTIPALTQNSGSTLTGNGVLITTPSSITTGGTANGINISASGVGAGTLNGINISGITGGAGTETALNIGSGWDSAITAQGAVTISGGTINLNASSNFATNIDTGTSTGAVSVGNSSAGALTLASGAASSFTVTSNNLTLSTASSGILALTSAGALNLSAASPSTITLASSSTTALNFQSGLLDFDTTNSRIGIGNTAPAYGLDVNKKTVAFNSGKDGSLASFTTNTNSLPSARKGFSAVSANGYLYAIGGKDSGGTILSTVNYAPVNANGSIGAWLSTTALPDGRYTAFTTIANGYIYVAGGVTSSNTTANTVYYAQVNNDGTVGTWNTTTVLPVAINRGTTVATNGYIYIIGGMTDPGGNTGAVFTAYYAQLNGDGSISSWNTTTAIPGADGSVNMRAAVANGYIYLLGGDGGNANGTTQVLYATVNRDGTVGTWNSTTALPSGQSIGSAIATNGYLYYLGGTSDNEATANATIYYALLNADGTVGSWSTNANSLPQGEYYIGTSLINGYIYILGGHSTTSYLSSVYYTSTARVSVAGNLDLVGLTGQYLTSPNGDTGGTIYAGNIFSNNNLSVEGYTHLWQGLSVSGGANISGPTAGGNSLTLTGAPASSSTSSLLQLGSTISGGSSSGTYIGLNSGSSYAGDLVNLEEGGNTVFKVAGIASGVNGFNFATSATGGTPTLTTSGTDTNVPFSIDSKGTGNINIGTGANAKTITIGNNTGTTALALTSGTGSQTFTSSANSTTTSSAFVFTDNALTSGTGGYFSSSSLTTGNLLQVDTGSANTITTGNLLALTSSATSLTSGSMVSSSYTGTAAFSGNLNYFNYAPGSAPGSAATGDILRINLGSNGSNFSGNLFNVTNNGTSLFNVSQSAVTASVPASFTAAGDVSMAYDLNFTNPTVSDIKSEAPLKIAAGETFNSSNLTLTTYNSGQGVFDFAGGATLNQAQTWTLAGSTAALTFNDSSANHILNLDSTNDRVGIGTITPSNTLQVVGSICAKSTNASCAGNVAGDLYATNTTVQSADVAENYVSSQSLEPGDLVIPASDGNNMAVIKTTSIYQTPVIGVVSTNPGVTLNSDAITDSSHPNLYPIALNGRVPIKVSTQNGAISVGDLLTPSSIPGVAMKATHPGPIIAKALDSYSNPDTSAVGKIMGFMDVSFGDPTNALANLTVDNSGNLVIPQIKTGAITMDTTLVEQSNINQNMLTISTNGSLDSSNLTQVGTSVSSSSSATNLASTITNMENQINDINSQIASQSAEIASVKSQTDVLSAEVASQSAQIASISATLAQTASASATPQSTSSATLATDSNSPNLTDPSILMATGSASLSDINVSDTLSAQNINVQNLQTSQVLKSLGQTELGQTTIAGNLSIDGTFSINNGNSLNALPTLYIQNSSLAQVVDLFNGQVTIDKTGNLTVQKLTVSSQTLGTAILKAGQTSLTITNPALTTNSKIFTSSIQPIAIGILSQDPTTRKFVLGVSSPQSQDLTINWWIVDNK